MDSTQKNKMTQFFQEGSYEKALKIADDYLENLNPDDLDGNIQLHITDVQLAPGGATCNITTPAGECTLELGINSQ